MPPPRRNLRYNTACKSFAAHLATTLKSSGIQQTTAAPPAHRGRRLVSRLAVASVVAFVAGFLWFVTQVPMSEVPFEGKADGIVALTGGPDRITEAVELLAAGRGKRMLITGVNPTTRMEEIARQLPRYEAQFNCCIDLDRSALNTIGNAVETRRWAQEQKFKSLVIVTARIHMPRALAELEHQMPDVTLIPYPVITERQRAEPWWTNYASTRALVVEYLKYLAAGVRMRLDWIVAVNPRATQNV
jgi:uncharacterized SAM-binding protein YcdF (DUF218 family)